MAVVAGRREEARDASERLTIVRAARPVSRPVARAGPAAHFRHLAQLADGLMLVLAFPLAYFIKTELLPGDLTRLYDPEVYTAPAALVAVATFLVLQWRGAYRSLDFRRPLPMLGTVIVAVGFALVFAATVLYALRLFYVSRLFVGLYGASCVTLLVLVRIGFRPLAERIRSTGAAASRVLLVGEGEEAEHLEKVLDDEAAFGIHVVDRLSTRELRRAAASSDEPGPLDEWLAREAIDEVALATSELGPTEFARLVAACDREGVALHVPMRALGMGLERATLEQMGGVKLLSVNPQEHSAWARAVKRAIDLVAGPILIALSAPLWLVVAILIKLDSPGPVFFVQERIGLSKRRFRMIKFRTMQDGAEHLRPLLHDLNEADGPIFKLHVDPRVTRVGRVLRRFDIDEIPQLINVLLGQMSLVGPRPMLASEITGFAPWQRKRFSMLPGITGLWQVSNRIGDSFLAGLQTDLDYIDRWSLRLDLEILLRTLPAVLRDRGPR